MITYMPTLLDQQQSPGFPYGSPNLPDKIKLWAFLCSNLEFIPFSPKIRIFFDSKFSFWGIFACISSLAKSYFAITIIKVNCNGLYFMQDFVLSRLGTGLNCAHGRRGWGGSGWRGLVIDILGGEGGNAKKRVSRF